MQWPSQVRKENVFFSESKTDEHGNEIIKIQTKYDKNKLRPLVIGTPFLNSLGGVYEKTSQQSGKIVGYRLPVYLWGKDEEPTPHQKQLFECLTLIQELCHEYLEETYGFDVSERLSKVLKRDKSGPLLYAKLICSGKADEKLKILSPFKMKVKDSVKSIDPMSYFVNYCKMKMDLIIDSIYISETSVSIQVKLSECYLEPEPIKLTITDSDEETEELYFEWYK